MREGIGVSTGAMASWERANACFMSVLIMLRTVVHDVDGILLQGDTVDHRGPGTGRCVDSVSAAAAWGW